MSGTQYTRIVTNYNLDSDIQLLIYSYLSLEEVLTIFRNDITTRDKIIKFYFKKLPNIDDASKNGDLETIKYLYDNGILLTGDAIDFAIKNGHLEVVKFLHKKGIKLLPTDYAIDLASKNGHLDIVMYLFGEGIQPTTYAMNWASRNGHLDVVKFLYEKNI